MSGDSGLVVRFVLAALAAWRVAYLLAEEDGPFAMVARLRAVLGRTPLGSAMDCFGCVSLWVAAPFAFFVAQGAGEASVVDRGVSWLALAGAASLLDRATRPRDADPIVIETLAEPAEEDFAHGLLQSTPNGDLGPGRDISARSNARADA